MTAAQVVGARRDLEAATDRMIEIALDAGTSFGA